MAANTSGSERCSYRECHQGPLPPDVARVDVCTVMPSKAALKKIKAKLIVSWTKNGDASFHVACWEDVLKMTRSGRKKTGTMLATEKEMVKEASETAERHDSWKEIREKGRLVAELIRSSEHCVCFTGAGISTSAGIGDYRGKSGKWTSEDREAVDMDCMACREEVDVSPAKRRRFSTQESVEDEKKDEVGEEGVPYESLRPTYTHEALTKLMEMGLLKYVISQNGDGLHTLAGIMGEKISELHGNVFLEKCEKCSERYERSYYVLDDHASLYFEELEDNGKTDILKPRNAKQCDLCRLSHRTGRKCEEKGCKGFLMDTIINFRDNLEDIIYDRAVTESQACDLMLCLGTTLTVTPANELVEMGKRPLRIVICNRQSTHLDKTCEKLDPRTRSPLGCRVFGDCDRMMREVMRILLQANDLEKWEAGREDRMKTYDAKRQRAN